MDLRVPAGESVEAEHTRAIEGVPITFHDIRIPMRNASGEIVGLFGIARDVTDRRKRAAYATPPGRAESSSKIMQSTLDVAKTVAKKDGIVLLLGESGSGKDFLARFIHDHSARRDGPFFTVNCAALPHELAESELFGHEPGAFTGARTRKRGLLELAEGGTLLINEVGELPLPLQAKLLTFLDSRSLTRVGGERTVPVNARIIAATNKDLETEVQQGRFREDLYYRINVFAIRVPPLRERKEDIPMLVSTLIAGLVREMQLPQPPFIDEAAMQRLALYQWPGNVRELRNVLERALMLWEGGPLSITVTDAPRAAGEPLVRVHFPEEGALQEVTDAVVKALCLEALRRTGGNKREAARILGISRNSLYRYLSRVGISFDFGTHR